MVNQVIFINCITIIFILFIYSMQDNLDCYNMLVVPKRYDIIKMVRNLDVYPITGFDSTGNYIEKVIVNEYKAYGDIQGRFSYFALVNCDYMDTGNSTDKEPVNGPIDVKYMKLHITNSVNTCKELRYPYNKSQTIYVIMTIIAAVLLLSGLFEYYKLKLEARNHWVALIFVVSIFSFFIFCLFSMASYLQSCKDGNLNNELMGVAVFFQALHEAFFILHILLLCKGWGLFKYKISIKERMIIGCYFMSYLVLIMNSMFWKYFRSEIDDDQNFFVTAPGIIYLIVRLLSFFLMHRNLYHSVPNDSLIDNKFILVVYIYGVLYIFSPCIGCLISLGFKDFEKYFVVDTVNTAISAFTYLVLIIFYFPSHLTKTLCPNYFTSDSLNPAYQQSYMKDDVTGKIEHGYSILCQLQAKLLQVQKQCVAFNSIIEKTVHELGLDPNTYIARNNPNPVPTLSYTRHEEILKRAKGGKGGKGKGGGKSGGGNNNNGSSSSFNSDDNVLLPKSGNKMVIVNNDVAGSMRGPKDDDDDDDNDNNSDNDDYNDDNGNKIVHSHAVRDKSKKRRGKNDDIDDVEYNNNINNMNNNGRISHGAPFDYSNTGGGSNKRHTSSDRRDHSEITTPMSNRHNNNNNTPPHNNSNHTTPNRYYNDRNQQDREYDLTGNRMGREISRHNDIMPKNSLDDNNNNDYNDDDDYHRPRVDSNGLKPPPSAFLGTSRGGRGGRGVGGGNIEDDNEGYDNRNNRRFRDNTHRPPPIDPSTKISRDNYGNSNNYYDNNYTDFNKPPKDSSSTKHRGGGGDGGIGGISTSQTSNRSSQPRRLEPLSRNSSNRNLSGTRLEPIRRSSGNNRNEVDVINLGGRRTPLHNEYRDDYDDDRGNEPNPLLDALN